MGVQDEMNGQDQNLKMNVQFPNFNFKKKFPNALTKASQFHTCCILR
jgi:hypothetical protein